MKKLLSLVASSFVVLRGPVLLSKNVLLDLLRLVVDLSNHSKKSPGNIRPKAKR